MIGDLFEHGFVVIAAAEAQRGQRDATITLALDHRDERVLIRHADIEIAIGGEDHAVDAAFDEIGARGGVGEPQTVAACGRTSGGEPVERGADLARIAGRFEHEARRPRIDHDRHAVARGQFAAEPGQRRFDQRQLVGIVHRARYVEQEDQIGRRAARLRQIVSAQADPHELRLTVPRRGGGIERDGEGCATIRRARIIVAEIIDHLLGPHRGGWRQLPLRQIAAGIGIGAGIDIDREGGDRLVRGEFDRGDRFAVIALAIGERQGLVFGRRRSVGHHIRRSFNRRFPMDFRPFVDRNACDIDRRDTFDLLAAAILRTARDRHDHRPGHAQRSRRTADPRSGIHHSSPQHRSLRCNVIT